MSLSPTKHKTLSRQPSSPSLAVGLPPALPESNIMHPSSPSKISKSKSRKRIHRGDVSSSAASSENEDEETGQQITPKRRIINPIDAPLPPSTGKKPKAKMSIQERLAAAANAKASAEGGMKAKVKSSRSLADMSSSISEPSFAESLSAASVLKSPHTRSQIISSRSTASSSSDKVVVCVRIKPTESSFANVAYDITPASLALSDDHPKVKQRGGKAGREDGYTYTFDKLLQYPSRTPELYEEKVAPLVDKAMNGFNSTIFAYGQTGSGKSFTMTGTADELGIIPCAVDGVFDAITADTERAFLLRVSYIEIYNETLRDLLNFKKGSLKDDEKPAIHYTKGKVYVDPLTEEIVSTPQDVMDLLEKGNAQRRIGATDWNERSSRSHCVFTIVVESRPRDENGDDDIRLSRLNLIDLAGSEKAVSDSERRGEGKYINQSLLALREVINKLTEKTKATHIPYRNSKLTHLLENALGGDSNICVICTMSAEEEHCGETLETLKFAGRCSQVKTNAKKNVLQSTERALIKAKDREIEELKLRLGTLTKSNAKEAEDDSISDLAGSVAAMEARKSKLVEQLSKLNSEILTSELPRSNSGLPLSPPKPKRRRISDFSAILATGTGRVGIGLGTPKKTGDRRAISGMSRLTEEGEEMPGILGTLEHAGIAMNFEQDRALAAARRNLATKEEELSLANRNLASALARASQLSERVAKISSLEAELKEALDALATAQHTLEHTETNMKDRNAQLEATRSELVATIEERGKRIDELENKVIDLRNSREELVMEDQTRLDQVQKELESIKGEKDVLQAELEAATKQVDAVNMEKNKEVESLKTEIANLTQQQTESRIALESATQKVSNYESTLSTYKSELDDLTTSNASQVAEIAKLHTEKSLAERQIEEARADLDRFQREAMSNETKVLGELRDEIGNLRKARDEDRLTRESREVEMQQKLQEEQRKNERLNQDLEAIRAEAADRDQKLQDQLAEALSTLAEAAKANAALEDQIRQQAESRTVLEADKTTLSAECSDLRAQLVQMQGHESKLSTAQQDLENLEKELEHARSARQDIERRLNEMEKSRDVIVEEKEKLLREERTAREEAEQRTAQLSTQREANLEGVKEMRRKLDQEMTSRRELEGKLASLRQQQAASSLGEGEMKTKIMEETAAKEELSCQLNKAKEELESLASLVKEKDEIVQEAKSISDNLQSQLAKLETDNKGLTDALQAKEAELAQSIETTQGLSSQSRQLSAIQQQLDHEVLARQVAERHLAEVSKELITKHESAQQILEEELLSLRQSLKASQEEASRARSEIVVHQARANKLSSELQDLKNRSEVTITTSISSRLRHSAPGPGHGIDKDMSATALDSLRSRSKRGASIEAGLLEKDHSLAMLRGREEEEIERLEKIIEVQKEIIDEQREKIERWAKEMEKQREIVRLLTNDNSAPSALSTRTGSPRGHGKSHSISHSPIPSPLPNAKGLVSTFTARNLALPTSPSPLPMHPSQISNSSMRKGRRVTIEHDIDRLAETSKVNKAKAIFESPEKHNSTPATPPKVPLRATQSIRSVPRQRRP